MGSNVCIDEMMIFMLYTQCKYTYLTIVMMAVFQVAMTCSRLETETKYSVSIIEAPFITLDVTNALESISSVKEKSKEQKGGKDSLVQHD